MNAQAMNLSYKGAKICQKGNVDYVRIYIKTHSTQ